MLKGGRITLRALEPSDAPTMARWYADHEFSVLDGNIYPSSKPQIEEFIRSLPAPGFGDVSLGIEDERRKLIGVVRLKRGVPETRRADLGIAIERGHWSQGYGTDAIRTLLRFAFDEMQLNRVELGVAADNERARRCYEKCGFVEEGRRRSARNRFGRRHDVVVMSVLADEWRATDHERQAVTGNRVE